MYRADNDRFARHSTRESREYLKFFIRCCPSSSAPTIHGRITSGDVSTRYGTRHSRPTGGNWLWSIIEVTNRSRIASTFPGIRRRALFERKRLRSEEHTSELQSPC